MLEKKIKIQKTVRYFIQGNMDSSTHLLIAFHGYGQLPNFFGKKFENVPDNFLIIIPEGMHRFYLKGSSGRVGASWMTREAREDDIEDNLTYIEQLIQETTRNKSFEKIILLGFSQGGATAARFFYSNKFKIDHLILWASVFPPDLNIQNEIKSNSHINYFIIGSEDPYFTDEDRNNVIKFYEKMNYSIIKYTGNHTLEVKVLNDLLENIV